MMIKTVVCKFVDSDLGSSCKLQILFQYQYNFLLLILEDRKAVLVKILSHMRISYIYLLKSSYM